MKKLIVFSVVSALLGTFAFAQADFSAGGAAKVQLMGGDSKGNDLIVDDGAPDWFGPSGTKPSTEFASWFWVSASKTNDDNTAGAKGAMKANTDGGGPFDQDASGDVYFYAWWQPIEQVFFKLGKVGENGRYWAGTNQTAWGFQSNDLLIDPALGPSYWNGYAGGYFGSGHGFFDNGLNDHTAMQLSIIPMDMLTIPLGFAMRTTAAGGVGFRIATF